MIPVTRPSLLLALSVFLIGAPALAQAPSPTPSEPATSAQPAPQELSGLTVSPKAAPINPKLQCADEACIQAVVQTLKTRYPREYAKLMRWCMSSESERMALKMSEWSTLLNGNQTLSTDPAAGEKTVCDNRFAKK